MILLSAFEGGEGGEERGAEVTEREFEMRVNGERHFVLRSLQRAVLSLTA